MPFGVSLLFIVAGTYFYEIGLKVNAPLVVFFF